MEKKNEQLCPTCQTGANSVKLDPREPFCPYINLHKGNCCAGYVPLAGGAFK